MARSTICGDTGQGATITATSGLTSWQGKPRTIDFSEDAIDMLDCSHLGTTGFRSEVATDLRDGIEVSITYLFDTFDSLPAVGGSLGTFTVTFPLRTGETTAANVAGSAFVKSHQLPSLKLGELQEGKLTVKYDNVAVPMVFTKSA